jgi:dethiobiotin synthetase
LSPHLAARRAGSSIHLERIVEWLALAESAAAESRVRSGKDLHSAAPRTTQRPTRASGWSIVETAGGVFTPLEPGITNFELAVSLEPSFWILVARDALGTLHDVRVTLLAMNSYNRMPDAVLLSAGRSFDESTGTNADELRNLRIANPVCALGPNEDRSLDELVALLGRQAR